MTLILMGKYEGPDATRPYFVNVFLDLFPLNCIVVLATNFWRDGDLLLLLPQGWPSSLEVMSVAALLRWFVVRPLDSHRHALTPDRDTASLEAVPLKP